MSWRATRSFLKTAFLITLPAVISIWLSYRVYQIGVTEKSMMAWVVLFLASPFTLFFTLLALAFNGLSLLAALLLIVGRRSTQFRVFTNVGNMGDVFSQTSGPRSEPRDVTPRPIHILKESDFER